MGADARGGREAAIGPGAVIDIPTDVRVAVRTTGAEPLSDVERAAIRARHAGHTRQEQP